MSKWFYILILVVFTSSAQAQERIRRIDTISDEEIEQLFFYKTKYQVRIGSERTIFSDDQRIKLNYYKFGIQFRKHYKFGLILFGSREVPYAGPPNPEVNSYELKYTGYGGYFEYVFIENYRFTLSSPLTYGSLRMKAKAYNGNDKRIKQHDWKSGYFNYMSTGVTAGYSINYWFVLSAGVGYRYFFDESSQPSQHLGTPYFSLGFKIRLSNLGRSIFKRKEVLRMKAIYFRDRRPEKAAKIDAQSRK